VANAPTRLPIEYCSDPAVQAFIEDELRNVNPYAPVMSARQLFEAARREFGDYRCIDLEFWVH
jgi:hypothetical protein